jgi:leucine-rich repeat protein SHOC2
MGHLTSLERLWLEDNKLRSFPSCILKLTRLTTLRISGNGLTELPAGISKLTKLQELVCHLVSLIVSFAQEYCHELAGRG